MPLSLDDLTCLAVAAPHDKNRAKVLADLIDETEPAHEDGLVAKALRDGRRAPRILRTVWQVAQDKNVEPSYRLLWSVVILGVKEAAAAPTPTPAPAPVPVPDPYPLPRRRRPGLPYGDDAPWLPGPSDGPFPRDYRWRQRRGPIMRVIAEEREHQKAASEKFERLMQLAASEPFDRDSQTERL